MYKKNKECGEDLISSFHRPHQHTTQYNVVMYVSSAWCLCVCVFRALDAWRPDVSCSLIILGCISSGGFCCCCYS